MLVLLAESRGSVRCDRLERSAKVLSQDEPFTSLGAERRVALIHEQTVIAMGFTVSVAGGRDRTGTRLDCDAAVDFGRRQRYMG